VKVLLFANTAWYLFNFRRSLADALKADGHEVVLMSPPDSYGEKLAALGFEWVPAPMRRRSLNPLAELALVMWLARFFRKSDIDVVHGFTIKCAVYGSLAAMLSGKARISAVAGLGFVFTNNALSARALRPLLRMLMRLVLGGRKSRVILQNPDDASLFVSAGIVAAENIRLVPGSGVDCSRFAPDLEQHAQGQVQVLMAARILWDKGIGEFVEAARQVRRQHPHVEFLLAGEPDDGNPAAVRRETIRSWADEGLITWLGHVEDMPSLLRRVQVAVLPSYREGLPKGLIEAAACELALVTTDVPGCREVVSHGIDGLLVPPQNAAALADAIALLVKDPDLRRRLGAAARKKALSAFDQDLIIRKTIAVYDELWHTVAVESPWA
jgi:glycosyltransferase involved in cell wall biosynthesis